MENLNEMVRYDKLLNIINNQGRANYITLNDYFTPTK